MDEESSCGQRIKTAGAGNEDIHCGGEICGLGPATSCPEVEDTTTHLREDVSIYLSDSVTIFGWVEREGRDRNNVFVWHLEEVPTNSAMKNVYFCCYKLIKYSVILILLTSIPSNFPFVPFSPCLALL